MSVLVSARCPIGTSVASARVEKALLTKIDGESAKFLRFICHLPDTSTIPSSMLTAMLGDCA